ncbi:hypothetical protein CR513_03672, partial [Mucuna pruriens]
MKKKSIEESNENQVTILLEQGNIHSDGYLFKLRDKVMVVIQDTTPYFITYKVTLSFQMLGLCKPNPYRITYDMTTPMPTSYHYH